MQAVVEVMEVILIATLKNTWLGSFLRTIYTVLKKIMPMNVAIIVATILAVATGVITTLLAGAIVIGIIIILALLF